MTCRDRWTELVDLAEGKPSAELEAHLTTCPDCARELRRLRRMMDAAHLAVEPVPSELVARAKALMPLKRRVFQLVRSSLQLSSARAVSQAFHAVYRFEDQEVRVAYDQAESGWDVISQLPASATEVQYRGKTLATDSEGRFFFSVRSLKDAGFTLLGPEGSVDVPSPDEASRGLD